MSLLLPRKKKIEDAIPVATLRVAKPNAVATFSMSNQQVRPQAAQPSAVKPTVVNWVPSTNPGRIATPNHSNIFKDFGAGFQQQASKAADVLIKGTAAANVGFNEINPFIDDQQRQQNFMDIYNRAEELRKKNSEKKDIKGDNFQLTSDDIGVRDIGNKDKMLRLVGESLDASLFATQFINPTGLAVKGAAKPLVQAAKNIGKEAGMFGALDATAAGATTYGETGDIKQSLQNAALTGVTSAALQGSLMGLGEGIGAGRRAIAKGASNAPSAPTNVAVDTNTTLARAAAQLEDMQNGTFRVDKNLDIPTDIVSRAENQGIRSIEQRDNPYGAAYQPDTRSIYLNDQSYATPENLFQELGHDAYFNKLTPEERGSFLDSRDIGYEQAKGRKGYTAEDLASEDFSVYFARALQGNLDDVPLKYRATVARAAEVALKEAADASPEAVTKLVEAAQKVDTTRPLTTTTGKPSVTGKGFNNADDFTDAELPRVEQITPQNALSDQQLLEARQQLNRPRVESRQAPNIVEQGDYVPVEERMAQGSQAAKSRYQPMSWFDKIRETWDKNTQGIASDRRLAKQKGVKLRDLEKTRSLEALAQRAGKYQQEAQVFLEDSPIARKIEELGYDTPEADAWNTYRMAMRHMEQVQDGRPEILKASDDEVVDFINRYEAENPTARQDLMDISSEYRWLQQEAARNQVVDGDTVLSAQTKQDGTPYQFWSPIERAMPDELQRGKMDMAPVAGGARQQIIQDFKGSELDLDVSFDPMVDYVNNVYKQIGRRRTGGELVRRTREGVPGARIIQEGADDAARKQLRRAYREKAKDLQKLLNEQRRLKSNKRAAALKMRGKEFNATKVAKQELLSLTDDKAVRRAIRNMESNELLDVFNALSDPDVGRYKALRESLNNRTAEHQQLVTKLDDLKAQIEGNKFDRAEITDDILELKTDPTTGRQTISILENGGVTKLEVDPAMARFLQGMGQKELSSLAKTAKKIQQPFRLVLTGFLNPPFQVLNAAWNEVMAGILSPQGVRVYSPRAIWHGLKSIDSSEPFQQALAAGGTNRFTGNWDVTPTTTTAKAIAENATLLKKSAATLKSPSKAMHKADIPFAKIENSQRTRVAYQAARARLAKKGIRKPTMDDILNDPEAIADAVYAYNNVLPNFGNLSNVMRNLDSALMYAGASQAGTRELFKNIARDPKGAGLRLAALTSAMAGLQAYNATQDAYEEFFSEMDESGKNYVVDNSAVLMLPGAHKVTKQEAFESDGELSEGEWVGVVKLPVPPELRPIQTAINRTMLARAQEKGVPLKDYAGAMLDLMTGGARTLSNPAIDMGYGLATGVDRFTGKEIVPDNLKYEDPENQKFDWTSPAAVKASEIINGMLELAGADKRVSPLEAEYVISKAGFPGKVVQGIGKDGGVPAAVKGDIERRFTKTYGKTEGKRYYENVDEAAGVLDNESDRNAFFALHGSDPTPGIFSTAEEALMMLNRPELYEAEKKLNDLQVAAGKENNPFFDLDESQRSVVLSMQANRGVNPGDKAMLDVIEKNNPWLEDYNKKVSAFYDKIFSDLEKSGGQKLDDDGNTKKEAAELKALGVKKPESNDALSKKFRVLEGIEDAADRAQFYDDNPDLTDYLSDLEEYNRAKRAYLNLPQLDRYPTNPTLEKLQKTYFDLPKSERKTFIKANPALAQFWADKNVYKLQEAAARARYETEDWSGDDLDNLMKVAKNISYNGYQATDGFYGGSGGGYGSGGSGRSRGSGGSSKVLNPRQYAIDINAGGTFARPTVKTPAKGKKVKKYVARKQKALPKVTIKKSKV